MFCTALLLLALMFMALAIAAPAVASVLAWPVTTLAAGGAAYEFWTHTHGRR